MGIRVKLRPVRALATPIATPRAMTPRGPIACATKPVTKPVTPVTKPVTPVTKPVTKETKPLQPD